jgi:hypothetical protein
MTGLSMKVKDDKARWRACRRSSPGGPASAVRAANATRSRSRSARLVRHGVDEDVRRLDVLVDDAPPVHLAECGRDAHGEPQECPELHCRFGGRLVMQGVTGGQCFQVSVQGLAERVLKNQCGAALKLSENQRSDGLRRFELGSQGKLMLEHSDAIGPGTFRRRHQCKDRRRMRHPTGHRLTSAQYEPVVLMNCRECVV